MKKWFNRILHNKSLAFFIEHYRASEMDLSSVAVAYYLLLTMFPFLILLANIFPYLNIDTTEWLRFLRDVLPRQIYLSIASLIRSIFDSPSSSLLWVSIVTGIWTTSRSMTFLQKAMNKAYDVQEHRDFIIGHAIGGLVGVLLVLLIILAILMSTFGETVINLLYRNWHLDRTLYRLLLSLTQPMTFVIFVLALGLLYFILPNVKIRRLQNILPGTLFTSIVLTTTTSLFGNYLSRAMTTLEDLKFFGSVTILGVMVWFIFFSRILIMGAIFNASYQRGKEGTIETRRGDVLQIIQERRNNNHQ